ncbi:hypothetical protein, partial [Limnoraphis robusta]
ILFSDVSSSDVGGSKAFLDLLKIIDIEKEAIVAFGNSEVEAINNSKSILEHCLKDFDEHKFNNIIKSSDRKPYLISPWG